MSNLISLQTIIAPYLNDSIESTLSFGVAEFEQENSSEISSTVIFSTNYNLGRFIDFDAQFISDVIDQQITPYLTETVDNIGTVGSRSIKSTAVVPNPNVLFDINPVSIESTLTFGPRELDFAFDLESLNVNTSIGVANVFVSVGPVSIQSTEQFGVPTSPRVVHRSLIFKDDNISKLGIDDDVEIASGIVLRGSTQVLTGNTVPGSAAGYMLVTISGVDYKMPFFNL